jgi:hypothetical protein
MFKAEGYPLSEGAVRNWRIDHKVARYAPVDESS